MKITIEKAENGYIVHRDGYFTVPRVFTDIEDLLEYCRGQLDGSSLIPPAPVCKMVGSTEE